jgi:GNAT superfamily N-acetyltransferase
MLHDFNVEFGTPTPGVEFLVSRCRELIESGEATVVLGGDPPLGLGVLFFRPSLWSEGLEVYLAELYVVPDRRDEGIGGAIMATAMELSRERGATDMQIGVDEPDIDTRRFYERLGFRNHDPDDRSARMFFYEREL